MPTNKMKMTKVEILEDTDKAVIPEPKPVAKSAVQIKAEKEETERIDPPLVNEVAESIEVNVIVVPLGTNHRQVRIAFDIRTNKVQPKDIPIIVETVLTKAAPMVGEKLVEIISVEKVLIDATTQQK